MAYKLNSLKGIEPVKPQCRKKIYNSPEEAEAMIRYIMETRNARKIRSYRCPVCGLWHLTSKSE